MGGVNLKAVLAGVAGAGDDDFLAVAVESSEVVELEVTHGHVEDIDESVLCLGTLHGYFAVVGTLVLDGYVKALGLLLDPRPVLVDVGGIDDEEELVVVDLVDEQVVDRAAVVVAHHAVEDLTVGGAGDVVDEDVVDVFFSLGAFDANLAHVADVENADVMAHCVVLLGDGAVLDGHIEASEGAHEGAELDMAVMQARLLKIVFHWSIYGVLKFFSKLQSFWQLCKFRRQKRIQ